MRVVQCCMCSVCILLLCGVLFVFVCVVGRRSACGSAACGVCGDTGDVAYVWQCCCSLTEKAAACCSTANGFPDSDGVAAAVAGSLQQKVRRSRPSSSPPWSGARSCGRLLCAREAATIQELLRPRRCPTFVCCQAEALDVYDRQAKRH